MKADRDTKDWIRCKADELAVANGCRFDVERGQFVIDWAAKYLKLYEGEQAGEPLIARDWQIEATMRMFGWVKYSERWGREVRRFTKASIWVPKKNKKSPTLAWWGLYLLCADGEMGQKVYFGAKDGSQAREIAGKHCIEMVLSSPELLEECTINRSLMQITHEPSRSILKPISSGDSKAQKSKEGLNGSLMVDETHVVDRAFMNRVSRAGISRSEPLQIEVSTAGDDPQSYGKSQFDYGKQVNDGERRDERFFYLAYSAPQDLTDAELDADPVKYGKIANPAWGHTVGEEEFLDDYNRSKASLSDLAEFKMYRLNIWLSASNPVIRPDDWRACHEDFDLDELLGRECYAGLDLGFKWDTSSLQLIFPWEGDGDNRTYRLLSFFWLPEATADKERKQVKWLDWGRGKHITITSGNISDFPLMRREIVKLRDKYDIAELVYDERFAQVFCQQLQDEDGMNVTPFPQTAGNYNEPFLEFENLIIDGRLKHRGNEVMDWQVSQLAAKDRGGVKMPAKPDNNALARIDGPVAAIMALASAMNSDGGKSIYSEEGNFAL